jgi:exonuclease SbcC
LEVLEYQKQKIDCIEPTIEDEKELQTQIEGIQAQIEQFKSNGNIQSLKTKRKPYRMN